MSVNIHFAGPCFDRLADEHHPQVESWDVVVDSFDLDFGNFTVDPDHNVGGNETLAVPSGMHNEEGEYIGVKGWRIRPDAALVARMPDVQFPLGSVFGRIIIT